VLHVEGRSLLKAPYEQRRELLERLDIAGSRWGTPPAFVGDGAAAVAASQVQGLEGVVAKRRNSVYVPGSRSRDWLKIKNIRTQDVVVGGWRPGTGSRAGGIGSLLVGVPGPDGLAYAGHVGTGFTQAVLAQLLATLLPLVRDDSPFAEPLPRTDALDALWVEPRLVGEVGFAEWTKDGRLRHPTWRGQRADRAPADVVREG
jgi:bifunctional non-homologous end joining protein LigD